MSLEPLLFRGGRLDMTAKETIPLEGIGLDHKLREKISASLENFFERNCQRYIVNMITEESTGD